MLVRLSIKNYALIGDIEMHLGDGLTILTGETGAGKSIILGAISLLTGNRADLALVKNASKKCVIEAEFDTDGLQLEAVFQRHDLDYERHTVIRREFGRDGKSRAFVNDTPAVLNQMKDIVNRLIDVHSQHENLELNKRKYQLGALDVFAGNTLLLGDFTRHYALFREAQSQLEELRQRSEKLRENTDYLLHQYTELKDAELQEGELERLEAELTSLNHSEEIIQNLSALDILLNQSEQGPHEQLTRVAYLLRKTRQYLPDLEDLVGRMESQLIELDDIRRDLAARAEASAFDPGRLQVLQDRVSRIYQLQQKHRVAGLQGLLKIRDHLEAELHDVQNMDDLLETASKTFEARRSELHALAQKLTKARSASCRLFEEAITGRLHRLGMVNSRFGIELSTMEEFGPDGKDDVEFLFTANKGMPLRSIAKVASGGELSRVMLSIKAVLAEKTMLPSIIFDEIDSGISGDIADKMGRIIREMSKTTQVLAISHLPQVAAQGKQHFKVYKDDAGEVSETRISELQGEEQVMEIARLLSGEAITPEAISNAKVLLTAG